LDVAERMPLRLRLVSVNEEFFMSKVRQPENAPDQLAQDFVRFSLDCGVLKFGEFKTKAGRMSPYFFNAGGFDDGGKLLRLAQFYAQRIIAERDAGRLAIDMLFGPAYKGIPLVSAVAIELARLGWNLPYAFNRKEAKDHGEGGSLVGAPLRGRVLVVDDVMSAGTAAKESIAIISQAQAQPVGIALALDREEKAKEAGVDLPHSAVQFVRENLGLQVCVVARLSDLLHFLQADPALAAHFERVAAYRAEYGV
jgi:orotate phosphoribosyltransferase